MTIDSGNDSGTVVFHAGTQAALNATLASFTYTAATDIVGDSITVTVNDGNATGVGGAKDGAASLRVVTAPNDIPVFNSPANPTYYYTANNAIPAFSFTDTYYGDNVTATVTVNSGTVHLTANGSATVGTNDTAQATITGSIAEVNTALAAMTYTTTLTSTATDTFTVSVDDNNANGFGGEKITSKSITVTMIGNDIPGISLPAAPTYYYAAGNALPGITYSDTLSGPTLTATVTDLHGTLHLSAASGAAIQSGNDTSAVVVAGTYDAVNSTLQTLTYSTSLTATGTDTVTVTVNDGGAARVGGAKSYTTSLSLTEIGNDTPSLTVPGTQTIPDLAAHKVEGVSLADTYSGNAVTATLSVDKGTLNTTASGGASVSGAGSKTLTVSGSVGAVNAALAELRYTTTLNNPGSDTITLSVNDGGTNRVGGSKSVNSSIPISVTYTPPPPPTVSAPVADVKVSVLSTTPTSTTASGASSTSVMSVSTLSSTSRDSGTGINTSSSVSVGGTSTNANNSDGHRSITADSSTTTSNSNPNQVLMVSNMGGVGGANTTANGAGNQVLTITNMGGSSLGGSAGGGASSPGLGGSFGSSFGSSTSFNSSGSSFSSSGSSFSASSGTGFSSGPSSFSTPSSPASSGTSSAPSGFTSSTGSSSAGPSQIGGQSPSGAGIGGTIGADTGSTAGVRGGETGGGTLSGNSSTSGVGASGTAAGSASGTTGDAATSGGRSSTTTGEGQTQGSERGQGQDQGQTQNRDQAPERQNQNRNQAPEQQNQNRNQAPEQQTRTQGPNRGQNQGGERGANPTGEPNAERGQGGDAAPPSGATGTTPGPHTLLIKKGLFEKAEFGPGPLTFTQQLAQADSFEQSRLQLERAFLGLPSSHDRLAA